MVKLIRLKIFSQLRERKKKLAEEKTELVAYVDASRRCVTDAMGQKVGFCLMPKVLSYQPIVKILLLFFVWEIFFGFSGPTLPFSSFALCKALQNCSLLKLRTLFPR